MNAVTRLLDGVRILAVEQYGAGPYGTQLLAELGAEVVKIENDGDISRRTGPYMLGEDDSQFFQTFSRSKKSVVLDLKSEGGRADFERLVRSADAVVNNLRGTVPGALGIDYPSLRVVRPDIVCAHLSAYGRDNSRAGWPGYDYLMQAECGFLAMTGEPGTPPTRFGLSMVDFMSGSVWAMGILAGILRARTSGIGCDVDVSLFDVAMHQLSYPAVWMMNADYRAERMARGAHPSIAPSQLVRTRDGWGFLMCQTPAFWQRFCEIVGRVDLLTDPRFASSRDRHDNLAALTEILDAIFAAEDTAGWIATFAGRVPFAPVNDVAQALDNPFVAEVGMVDRVAHPAVPEGLRMLACPIRVDGARMPGQRAPALGEHDAALGVGERAR
jgi:crotonobetainyl-CoA:carnitine CoA-transferase CaiB-like acyl-CoA transferase